MLFFKYKCKMRCLLVVIFSQLPIYKNITTGLEDNDAGDGDDKGKKQERKTVSTEVQMNQGANIG